MPADNTRHKLALLPQLQQGGCGCKYLIRVAKDYTNKGDALTVAACLAVVRKIMVARLAAAMRSRVSPRRRASRNWNGQPFNNHPVDFYCIIRHPFVLGYSRTYGCSSLVTECKYFIPRSRFFFPPREQAPSRSAAAQNTLLMYKFETPPMLPLFDIIPFRVVHISEHFIKSPSAYYFAC